MHLMNRPFRLASLLYVFLILGACETVPLGNSNNNNSEAPNGSADELTWQGLGIGLTGPVNDFILFDGDIIAAGGTTFLSRWDGNAWSQYGGGVGGPVTEMGVFGGELVIGGVFETAGGAAVKNIATYDGINWHGLGDGLDGTVLSIGAFEGDLIAGGLFESSGSTNVSRIARWDDNTWSALGDGFDGPVYTIVEYQGTLIVGGAFGQSGNRSVQHIAIWDGATWSEFGGGTNDAVYELIVIGDTLVAGGAFTRTGAVSTHGVARWTGSAWQAYGGGVSGCNGDSCLPTVLAMAVFNDKLVIGGNFLKGDAIASDSTSGTVNGIATWDGQTWQSFESGLGGAEFVDVRALLADQDALLAGGRFSGGAMSSFRNVAIWSPSAN